MLDLDCKRDEALAEYKEALATRDGQQDTRLAAERGVKTAYAVKGHSCEDDADDGDARSGRSRKPQAEPERDAQAAIDLSIEPSGALDRRMSSWDAPERCPVGCSPNRNDAKTRTRRRVEADLAELEAALGHRFASPELLVRALTHRSLANEQAADGTAGHECRSHGDGDNERLEFLGDAVLGLVVAEALFLLHPEWHEGELTRVRAQLVSRQHMAEVADAIGLGQLSAPEPRRRRSGLRRKSTVLSNTMEAVMGALFLDGGLEAVRAFASALGAGRGCRATGRGVALGRRAGQLQIGAAGAPAGRARRSSGLPGQERERSRPSQALSGGGPAEGR